MAAQPRHIWTEAEYLEFERNSDTKHEYFAGSVYAMSGAREPHNAINQSAANALYTQLKKRVCKVYTNDMRVKVNQAGLYTYPDTIVMCGKPQLEDDKFDTLLNPILLIEVLSPSTENYDRGEKFRLYRQIDTLQEYVLIAQDTPRIERYLRQSSNEWLLTEVTGLDATLELPSIQCTLALVDVYEKVTFGE
jgi:Uma2 family endonuclease